MGTCLSRHLPALLWAGLTAAALMAPGESIREVGGWTNDFLAGNGLARGNPVAAAAPGLADAMQRLSGLN